MTARHSSFRGHATLLAIAIFAFVKVALLLATVGGAMSLFGKNVAAQAGHWSEQLRVDPDNRDLHPLLAKLSLVHTRKLKEISALSAALFLTEGTSLLFRQDWAEWLTIIATTSFIPPELYELLRNLSKGSSPG